MSVQIRACYVVAAQSDHMDRRQVFGKEGKKNPRPLTDFDDWSQVWDYNLSMLYILS